MSLRVLEFSLALLPDRICYLPHLTREHCVRIANGVLKVLFGSKKSFLLVLSALQVVQEPGRPLFDIRGVAHDNGARGNPSQGAIAGVFQSVSRYPGTKKERHETALSEGNASNQEVLRVQQHHSSLGPSVDAVYETPKKGSSLELSLSTH